MRSSQLASPVFTPSLARHLTASLAALALVASCGTATDLPESTDMHEVSGAVAPWPGEAQASCGDRITATRFSDDVGRRVDSETRVLLTSAQAYRDYFGHAAPASVDFSREWVVFYSAGRNSLGSTADVSVVGVRGEVLHVVTTLNGPIPPCAPPVGGGSGPGSSTGSGGSSGSPGSMGQTAPANPVGGGAPVPTTPVTDPAPMVVPPSRPLASHVLVKFAAQKTTSVVFQHQDITPQCDPQPEPPRCRSSNECGKGQRCSTERGDCQSCRAPDGGGGACPAVCFGFCEPNTMPTNPCAAILCGPGQTCVVLESYPPQARCMDVPKPNTCFGGVIMNGCQSAEALKLEADKLCRAANLALQDFGVGNACVAGGFAAAKYTCCGDKPTPPPPTPPPAVCKVDSDCRLTTTSCGQKPCTCAAESLVQDAPACAVPAIACLVDPCAQQAAACVKGQCTVVPVKR